jgi:hypothetical protein
LLTGIGLPHTEDVANRATRRVADDHYSTHRRAVANDSPLTVVPARVFDLDRHACEHKTGIFEVEPAIGKRFVSLGRVLGDTHGLLYLQ